MFASSKHIQKCTRGMSPWNLLTTWIGYPSILLLSQYSLTFNFNHHEHLTRLVIRRGEWGDHVTLQAAADSVLLALPQTASYLCRVANSSILLIELRCGYFGVTVWCQDSCTNFIQRYMLHRDTPERTKVKKRSVQFTNNACLRCLDRSLCLWFVVQLCIWVSGLRYITTPFIPREVKTVICLIHHLSLYADNPSLLYLQLIIL